MLVAAVIAALVVRRGRGKPSGAPVIDAVPARPAIPPTTAGLAGRIRSLFERGATEETWRGLEDALLRADVGAAAAGAIVGRVRAAYRPPADPAEVVMSEIAGTFDGDPSWEAPKGAPGIVMVVGVNGTGKTTTIGKLAHRLKAEGRTTAAKMAHLFNQQGLSVMLAAADTFRAAAIDQLKVWGGRVGAEVVAKEVGADPAGVAYEALERARAESKDVLLIDTAGRLQNKSDLMAELAKIVRVVKKIDQTAPHGVVLVLDATTGQNGIAQARAFTEAVRVTGVVLAKMDGTARGGIVLAVREELGVPVKLMGTGERPDDLAPFDPHAFARRLVA